MGVEDPERMPLHESTLSRARGGANVVRLGAIVGLTVQGLLQDYHDWRHPPVCPYCHVRIANTELHCHRCGADLPKMMFRSPGDGLMADLVRIAMVLGVLLVLGWIGREWARSALR